MVTYAAARPPPWVARLSNHGPTLALLGILSIQSGQAVAKLVVPLAGPTPVVALRFGLGALILLAIWRPRLPTDRATLGLVLGWGATLAGISLFLYRSLELLPFGVAVTVQFSGALAVSMIGSRRPRHLLWALLAGLGIVLIADLGSGSVSPLGLAFAAAAAACWGGFIVIGTRVGARSCDGGAVALATVVAALLTVPMALIDDPRALADERILLGGLAVAVLCSVVTNSLDLRALRLLPARTFGVLVSLEPVVAVLLGLALLGERLAWGQWLAVALIVAASIGASYDRDDPRRPSDGNAGAVDVHADASMPSAAPEAVVRCVNAARSGRPDRRRTRHRTGGRTCAGGCRSGGCRSGGCRSGGWGGGADVSRPVGDDHGKPRR